MPDLDSTVGGASANSFASIDDADLYLDARLNASAWTGASDDDKARGLIEASRDLSALEPQLQGYRTDAVQALCWPRRYVINTKAPITATLGVTGYPEYADDIIPTDWVSATIELAFEYLKAGDTDVAALDTDQAILQETVGPITTRYAAPATFVVTATGLAEFPRVLALVQPFLEGGGGLAVIRS